MKKLNLTTLRKNLSLPTLRVVLMVLLVAFGMGETWAAKTYNSQLTVTGGASGKGYVYAATAADANVAYSTSTTAGPLSSSNSGQADTYYAWVEAVRGAEFESWTQTSINSVTNPSGSNKYYTVTVKESTTDKGTNTGTLTAQWTTYPKVNVTYNPSKDGVYSVTYQYNSYNSSSKTITAGDAENLSRNITSENGAQTIGSYYNDVITLQSVSGDFQGWYSDADFNTLLSTANPYTYVAPQSGTGSVYAKYPDTDKYYGRLTASVAEVPYSMPAGGMIFISTEASAAPDYSENAQTEDNVGMGSTSLTYYLKAQPTDKRYVFRGWYDNAECTGTALSTNNEYTYSFTASSTNSASPTTGNIYAAFDFNLYYMQVDVQPATLGLGMVLVKDNNTTTPDYTEYSNESSLLTYMYRGASTKSVYLYAKAKYGYKFGGWYDNAACTGTAKSTANPYTYAASGTSTDPMNPTIITLYAKFVPATDGDKISLTYKIPDKTKGEYTASVLDITEVDDEYVWTFTEVYNSVDYTADKAISQHKTDVLRLEAAPKTEYGVTSWSIAGTTKTTPSQLYETSATETGKAYGVAFGDAKPFMVSADNLTTGTQYATLADALKNRGSNTKITVVQNAYVEAGNYTIPNGVTLLIPYESGYSITTLAAENKTWASRSEFRRLTLAEGANITIANGGAICLAGQQYGTSSNNPGPGSVLGAYSVLDMSNGGHITVSNGGKFYAYGYVFGKGDQSTSGTITVQSGGKVYECLAINDMHGGGGSAACVNGTSASNNYGLFPFNQYYIQNIEPKMTIEAGGFVYGAYDIVASGLGKHDVANVIGNSTEYLFQITSGSLVKWYDVTTDYQCYEVRGSISMNKIKVSASGSIALESSNFVLPVTNNMNIRVSSGAALDLPYALKLLPGTKMVIDEGAVANIKNEFYVYDYQDWDTYAIEYAKTCAAPGHTVRDVSSPNKLGHASLTVNGTLNLSNSAALYTTSHGGAIISNGTGKINFNVVGKSENMNLYECWGTYGKREDGKALAQGESNAAAGQVQVGKYTYLINTYYIYGTPVECNPAQLRNGDNSFLPTANAASGDKFIYSKNLDKWLKNPKTVTWNANGGTSELASMAYSEGAFVGVLPTASREGYTFNGWFTQASGGSQISETTKVTNNITYYAHWTANQYNITYMDQGKAAFSSTHIDTPNAHPTKHTYNAATTLNGANDKTGYTFGGWHTISNCKAESKVTFLAADGYTKDITLYAKWTPQTYTITYKDKDDADFSGTSWESNQPTEHTYGTATTLVNPSKANYTFGGWYTTSACTGSAVTSLGATAYTANITLYAKWTLNTYTVTWKNADATTLKTDENVPYGTTPTYNGSTPTKAGNVEYSYTFSGWSPEIVPVAENTTYTATFSQTKNTYTITWLNDDDTQIDQTQVEYGVVPTHADATKGATESTVYTFNGWTPELTAVTGEATYKATYTENPRPYSVLWVDYDGDTLASSQRNYGAPAPEASANSQIPTRASENGVVYTFIGWSDPVSVVASGDVTYTALYRADILAEESVGTVKINTDVEVATTTVRVSGRLNVNSSATLTTTDLILEAQANISGEITGNVQLNPGGHAYFDLYIHDTEPRHWHAFSVPFQVNLKKAGNPIQINGETLTLGRGYDIVFYDGAVRAEQGKVTDCWKYVEDPSSIGGGDSILYPGKAYMIASASRTIDVVRFTKADEAPLAYSGTINVTGGSGDNGGWNGIGNPTTYHAIMEAGPTVAQVHNGGKIGADGYEEYDIDNLKYVVGKAVFVQVRSNQQVNIYQAEAQEIIRPAAPARRNTRADINKEYLSLDDYYKVSIAQENNANTCNVYVLDEEEKEDTYVIGHDLTKFGINASALQMWVNRYNEQLGLNTTAPINGVASYPLGINAPQAGEYTISLQSDIDDEHALYLTCDGEAVWNLSDGEFVLYLDKGTTARYGLRLVEKAPQVATGMDELVVDAQGKTQKVLIENHVYIIRGNNIYTMDGQLVE